MAAPTPAPAAPTQPFGAIARIHTADDVPAAAGQRRAITAFIQRYNARTSGSKAYTQQHRAHLADPRAVSGFRPLLKELVYPIVVERSRGPRLWDVDGNEYVDVLNGFGMNLFGWQPAWIADALRKQIDAGYEIGPQHRLAGSVAQRVCALTGFDRAALCNTGSEAVLGALRIARTATGRRRIASFAGSYHGIFDEVLVRAGRAPSAVPAAPGILGNTAENVMVLDYGADAAIATIEAHADDLAAVLVEPVQSRNPTLQPVAFLHRLRELCDRRGIALVFDEVVTGFRCAPGGAQQRFGIQADVATYGKVIGGGLPIGVIAGRRQWMDALDGGHWQFGDASMPTTGVTYFAGTFVRHPLALAAADAVLAHLQQAGPSLQAELDARAAEFVCALNALFRDTGAPVAAEGFSSLWRLRWTEESPLHELLYPMLRYRGVHILEHFPCFVTTAHGDAELQFVFDAFRSAIEELQAAGVFAARETCPWLDASRPPLPGGRLGRTADGRVAWFVPDPEQPGRLLQVDA